MAGAYSDPAAMAAYAQNGYGQQQQYQQQQQQQYGQQQQQQYGQQQQQYGQQQQQYGQGEQYGQQQQQQGQQQMGYGQQNGHMNAAQIAQQHTASAQQEDMHQKYQDYIQEQEDNDGVRFSWNVFPPNRIENTRNVCPLAALFTPLKRKPPQPPINYPPLTCQQASCRAVLNPYCRVDFQSRVWTCCFCGQRVPFPMTYAQMTEENKAAELHQQYSTIEYTLPPRPGQPQTSQSPIFLFCIDTCISEADELASLKQSIQTSLSLLPPTSLVGVITFGKMIQLHELDAESPIPKSYVFRGTKDIAAKQLKEMLGLGRQTPQQVQQEQNMQVGASCKFLQPLGQIEMYVSTLIDEIQLDPWPTLAKKRPLRSTGVAMSIAIGLLESTYPNCPARILSFVGGACTQGPGMVIDNDRANVIRSWMDISSDNARYMKRAIKHYKGLAVRAATAGHAVDIIAGCLDQTGLHEMKTLCNSTGGHLIMTDSFKSTLFTQTYQKIFRTDEHTGLFEMAFNATLEIKTSKELKIQGLIGQAVSLNVKSNHVAEEEIGVGGTNQYRICSVTPDQTYGIYFQVANPNSNPLPQGALGYVQFSTNYMHMDGTRRVRVTTIARQFADPTQGSQAMVNGFDQEGAAVLMARLASFRCERDEPPQDVLRWLDRTLIRLCQKFGQYQKEMPDSFNFPSSCAQFPQFMFHLRRTGFLNVFGHSPDETAHHRYQLCRQDLAEAITMIQPQLYSYSFNGPPELVHLDSSSLQQDRILLLDTFFQVLIYHGETIHSWKKAGYHEKEEYANLKELIEAPIEDARDIISNRFPIPRYIETESGGSQARFLLARVNPSQTHQQQSWGGGAGGEVVLSDDVSLQSFVDHLKKLAVNPT